MHQLQTHHTAMPSLRRILFIFVVIVVIIFSANLCMESSDILDTLKHVRFAAKDPSQLPQHTTGTKYVEISDSSENVLPPGCTYARTSIDYTKKYDLCVVGAGLSGTVFAERTAKLFNESVLMIDVRPHIGGNLFDFIDQKTGILRNQYGSHLFHTNIRRVWNYINSHPNTPPWKPWYHQKYGLVNGTLYEGMMDGMYYVPIPVNIMTVNRLFGINIQTQEEMLNWLHTVQIPCDKEKGCQNAEEMAKSRVGEVLYRAIFETYTIKQWARSPRSMDASVTARIPVRSNFDPRYFDDKWQVFPDKGYTAWFEVMLDHPLIDVVVGTDFFDHQDHLEGPACGSIVYTGPIDRYFASQGLEKLEYRSIVFTEERHYNTPGYILPTPVVNFPGPDTPFTRAIEYKHYLHRSSPHSIVVKETSSDVGEPYYPVPNPRNKALYEKYKTMAEELEGTMQKKITFVGRLANYKYFNMDKAILNALELFDQSNFYRMGVALSNMFQGQHFVDYRNDINMKMEELRETRSQIRQHIKEKTGLSQSCATPFYGGEFGMELRAMVPWAYHMSTNGCLHLETSGTIGTKYMYWFSDSHKIKHNKKRKWQPNFPSGNPFNFRKTGNYNKSLYVDRHAIRLECCKKTTCSPVPPHCNVTNATRKSCEANCVVHTPDIPHNMEWQPPPFKEFFARSKLQNMLEAKPLVVIQNKYAAEWGKPPVNFISVDVLKRLLDYLTLKYTVVYKRFTGKKLADVALDKRAKKIGKTQEIVGFGDKDMIRKHFPSVLLFEDLVAGLPTADQDVHADDQNLLLFGIMALSDRFISVQGGVAVVSSFFRGQNTILIKGGHELKCGDYNYFHRFSNATVTWETSDKAFINRVGSWLH